MNSASHETISPFPPLAPVIDVFEFPRSTVGSAIVGLSTALNAISLHGTCTAVFVAVMAVAIYPFASLRTLGGVKWIGWVGLISILSAVLTVTIAVGVGGRPSLAPQEGPWDKNVVIWGTPSLWVFFLRLV